jgi:hypothetical protein
VTNLNPGVSGELCRIPTDDGLELNVFSAAPGQKAEARSQDPRPADSATGPQSLVTVPCCLVQVHGWDGDFHENRFIDRAADSATTCRRHAEARKA